ncbi:hypothetical protein L0244_14140 [bacterium]|nr:hypothetical protein [bacterium]
MKIATPEDLATVRAELQAWRAQRKGKERIPEKFWNAAIGLLDFYPFHKVCRELNLNTKQLKKRAEKSGKSTQRQPTAHKAAQQNHRSKQTFLKVSAGDLVNSLPISNTVQLPNGSEQTCRIVFERADGSRLSLSLPVELNLIQSICNGLVKA